MAGTVGGIALIDAVAGKVGGVADNHGVVAVDKDDARGFAAGIVSPFGTAAIVVTGEVVFDAVVGGFEEADAPPAIAARIVGADGVAAALDNLNTLNVVGGGDVLDDGIGDVVKHDAALGDPTAQIENGIVIYIVAAEIGIADDDVGGIGNQESEVKAFDGAVLDDDAGFVLNDDAGVAAAADDDGSAFCLTVNDLVVLLGDDGLRGGGQEEREQDKEFTHVELFIA